MTESENQFNPEESRELSAEAKEIILLFQHAKEATDPGEQSRLLIEFHRKLLGIVIPPGESHPNENPERLRKVVIEGSEASSNYIPVGGGTDGQRIWFKDTVMIENEEAGRLTIGAKVTQSDHLVEAESLDGKTRWMAYYMPGDGKGGSWKFGEKYWKRYIEHFGNQVVDLLQEIK